MQLPLDNNKNAFYEREFNFALNELQETNPKFLHKFKANLINLLEGFFSVPMITLLSPS